MTTRKRGCREHDPAAHLENWNCRFGQIVIVMSMAILGLSNWAQASQESREQNMLSPDKAAIEQTIHDYIVTHPEVIEEALNVLAKKKKTEEKARIQKAIVDHEQALFHNADSPVDGHHRGDVTIVEFFDYRCQYCKAVASEIDQLLHIDHNIRIIYKDYPILGEASIYASKAALASRKQGKYLEFHRALMTSEQDLTAEGILHIARHVGLDPIKLEHDMMLPDIQAMIQQNWELGRILGIRMTPGFIIGDQLIPGALPLKELVQLIGTARMKIHAHR